MASPSEAELQSQIGKVVHILDEAYKFGSQNTPNFVDLQDELVQAQEGDWATEGLAAVSTMRGNIAAAVSSAMHAATLEPYFRQYGKTVLDVPYEDIPTIISELRKHMNGAGTSIQERNFTFGVLAPGGGNVGDGQVHRLTVDENGYTLEATHADTKTVECLRDQNSGADKNGEVFEIRGGAAERDQLLVTGSGRTVEVRASHGDDTTPFVQNPSFEDYSGTGVSFALDGWSFLGSASNLAANTTTVYRGYPSVADANLASLEFLADDTVSQDVQDTVGARFEPGVPYYLQVAVYAGGLPDGTLTLSFGAVFETVDVSTLPNDAWSVFSLALGTKNWFQNFNQEPLTLSLDLSGHTTGQVLVDDVILVPMQPFDGLWWAMVGGQAQFLRDDVFSATDTEVGAKIQQAIWKAWGEYLPASAIPTWPDPT